MVHFSSMLSMLLFFVFFCLSCLHRAAPPAMAVGAYPEPPPSKPARPPGRRTTWGNSGVLWEDYDAGVVVYNAGFAEWKVARSAWLAEQRQLRRGGVREAKRVAAPPRAKKKPLVGTRKQREKAKSKFVFLGQLPPDRRAGSGGDAKVRSVLHEQVFDAFLQGATRRVRRKASTLPKGLHYLVPEYSHGKFKKAQPDGAFVRVDSRGNR